MKRQLLACLIAAALGASVASAAPPGDDEVARRVRPELRQRLTWHELIRIEPERHLEDLAKMIRAVDWLRLADDIVHFPRLARRVANSIS